MPKPDALVAGKSQGHAADWCRVARSFAARYGIPLPEEGCPITAVQTAIEAVRERARYRLLQARWNTACWRTAKRVGEWDRPPETVLTEGERRARLFARRWGIAWDGASAVASIETAIRDPRLPVKRRIRLVRAWASVRARLRARGIDVRAGEPWALAARDV